ncbi:protein kinase [Nitriliruptoraceae bacterium ZYF776]|nr:protein kinase [Profundirhabdus halotolerans]
MSEPAPRRDLPTAFAADRYRVTGELGAGGMGLVVRARDELLHRDVAIKLLAPEVEADDAARERFLREARAAAAIHDPRVVSVYDVGEEADRTYLVMECVDGPSLADVLVDDGPLPADDVADVAVDALVGLSRAHEAGLLHRDIKPANLLRAPDGTVKVTDFGVAEATDSARLTRTGFVVGTMNYLAPERRAGAPASVATDLWALGATLLELLTGRGPSTENRPDTLPPEVPRPLVALLRSLLADDPAARPATALDAMSLLATGTDGTVTATERTGHPEAVPGPRAPAVRDPQAATAAYTPTGLRAVPPSVSPSVTPSAPPAASDTEHVTDAETPAVPWTQVAVVAVVVLVAVLVLSALTDGGDDPAETGLEVTIEPDDPAGTLRDLGDQLRRRAGG